VSAVIEKALDMTLGARGVEFQRVIGSTEITDGAGASRAAESGITGMVALFRQLRERGGRLYVIGNGGSAGVASHAVTDFVNVGRLRATTLHDPSLITCMSNDYGYENAFARILSISASPEDVLVAISSSGQSKNICNAATTMRGLGGATITLSGFKRDNPLRALGDTNIWLDSTDYGMVEIGHQFVLHNIADRLRLGL
jgi:D-sedoheptulose 7-phosphate isomerase